MPVAQQRDVPSLPERPPAREACPAPEQTLAGTPSRRQSIINALLETDRTLAAIAAEHGVTKQRVSAIAKQCGASGPDRRSRRVIAKHEARSVEKQSAALRRTIDQAVRHAAIVELRRGLRLPQKLIASRVGINQRSVSSHLIAADLRTVPYRARSK